MSDPPSVEQLRYARVLEIGSKLGFVTLVAGFLAYVTGVLEEHVVVEQLPALWGLSLAEYLRMTQTPTGWGWIVHLHKGEFAGLLGIAVLALSTAAIIFLGVLPTPVLDLAAASISTIF